MRDWEAVWSECLKFKVQQKKDEFLRLLKSLDVLGVKRILEIGTNTGGTSRGFLEFADKVWSIDIAKYPSVEELEKEFPGFTFIQGDSRTVEFNEKVDMLYIDGDHSEEYCRADYERFGHLVKKGGRIVFHDIAKSELHEMQKCEVWKVFRDLSLKHQSEEYVFDDLRWGGIGVITV